MSENLASELRADLIHSEMKRFPDGECYVRIDRERIDERVLLVQNSYPDGALVELLLLQEAAMGLGASSITAVVPYFGYARQDRRFKPGEPISAKVMAEHIQLRSDMVITVDIHTPDILRYFDRARAIDVRAAPAIGGHFKHRDIDLVLAPDEGAADRARTVASVIGARWDYLVKTRLSGDKVEIAPKKLDVRDKSVLIVDDIISTGGTISAATKELRRRGAKRVVAACTHGLFAQGALERLRDECDEVVCSNTLEGDASVISVAPLVARAIRR